MSRACCHPRYATRVNWNSVIGTAAAGTDQLTHARPFRTDSRLSRSSAVAKCLSIHQEALAGRPEPGFLNVSLARYTGPI